MTSESLQFLQTLEAVIQERLANAPEGSYTARLAAAGTTRLAQKIGEEGVELALAAVGDDRDAMIGEAADLLYHMLVLLNASGTSLADVAAVLEERHAG